MDSATTQRLSISLLATLCLILIHSTQANSILKTPNAYEVLQQYDFPAGLLPRGLNSYDLDSGTGQFSAYFNESCSFSVQGSYEMKFKSTISGYITKGTLSGLSGVSVKFFLLSLNIVGILRNGDNLVFSAGAESAPFPIDNFEESPQCGCGFQCRLSE